MSSCRHEFYVGSNVNRVHFHASTSSSQHEFHVGSSCKGPLSQLSRVYDPLGIVSPTLVEGKKLYREACDETKGRNSELSKPLVKDYFRWVEQLKNVKVPRSLIKENRKVKGINLHIFANASAVACSSVPIASIQHETGIAWQGTKFFSSKQ